MTSDAKLRQKSSLLDNFTPYYSPPHDTGEFSMWFIFYKNELLIQEKQGSYHVPLLNIVEQDKLPLINQFYLGQYDSIHCFGAEINPITSIPSGYQALGLRQLFGLISDDLLTLAGRVIHLLYWDSTTQFCGRCGHTTLLKTDERAKECPQCGLINYPQLAPAVIILIEKDNEILLARSPRFKPKMYSVIAGFVEPGETLEQTVLREIREEVGIQVHNIQYFGSQHWPFPQSLMIAFTAQYLSGQITIDHREIEDADWFTIENLPPIPNKMSISRWLIDWFIEKHSKVK